MNDVVTVKDLVSFLRENFNPKDKVAFFDEGGAWCELVRVPKSLIGDWMFKYVSKARQGELKHLSYCKQEDVDSMRKAIDEEYRMVCDNDVIIY